MKEEERLDSSSSKSSSSCSLPVSYGVEYERYDISSSVSSLSQPFSPEGSSNRSRVLDNNISSVFSLDRNNSILILSRDRPCSCLHHIRVDSAEMLWLPLVAFLLPLSQFIILAYCDIAIVGTVKLKLKKLTEKTLCRGTHKWQFAKEKLLQYGGSIPMSLGR